MEVRLDAKVTSEKETRALGIEVGDFISFDPRTVVTETGLSSLVIWTIRSAQRFCLICFVFYMEEKIELPVTTHFAFQFLKKWGTVLTLISLLR